MMESIRRGVLEGDAPSVEGAVAAALGSGTSPEDVLAELNASMDVVCERFGCSDMRVLSASSAASAAGMDAIRPLLPAGCLPSGKAVAATVEGDVHDFGKNAIVSMLVGYGADVTDLGVDMPAEDIADAVESTGSIVVLLSASVTSTLASLEEAVRAVRGRCPHAVVMVGGPVVSREFSEAIGADVFTSDAVSAVRIAREVLTGRERLCRLCTIFPCKFDIHYFSVHNHLESRSPART